MQQELRLPRLAGPVLPAVGGIRTNVTGTLVRHTYLLPDRSFHLEIINMKSALRLLLPASPAPGTLSRVAFTALHGAMPITDAAVSLVEQFVAWYFVFRNIPLYEVEVPGV